MTCIVQVVTYEIHKGYGDLLYVWNDVGEYERTFSLNTKD